MLVLYKVNYSLFEQKPKGPLTIPWSRQLSQPKEYKDNICRVYQNFKFEIVHSILFRISLPF